MTKTKEELEQAIEMLDAMVVSNTSELISVQADLAQYKLELKDINKPVITSEFMDAIQEAIEEGVGEFDFDDEDNYDKEFGIDYDNRIELSNFDFTNSSELVEMITEHVHRLFVEKEEDND